MNWILTIAHNALLLTRNAVATFLAQDIEGGVKLLVINNASTDNTVQWLTSIASKDDRIHTMHFSDQRSVAECWNRGLAWIFAQGADRALVVNNDVELRPDTYRLLLADGGPFVTAVGVNTREQMMETLEPEKRRNRPDFSCWLMQREVWDMGMRFDEGFRIAWFEDNAMHVEMHRNGISAYCIGVPFYHIGSGTLKNTSEAERLRFHEAFDHNKERFRQMYGCYPSDTAAYDALFDPSMFGVNKRMAGGAEP